MAESKYAPPSHKSRTRKGTPPNQSAKAPVPGSYKGKPSSHFSEETREWNQVKVCRKRDPKHTNSDMGVCVACGKIRK